MVGGAVVGGWVVGDSVVGGRVVGGSVVGASVEVGAAVLVGVSVVVVVGWVVVVVVVSSVVVDVRSAKGITALLFGSAGSARSSVSSPFDGAPITAEAKALSASFDPESRNGDASISPKIATAGILIHAGRDPNQRRADLTAR